MTTTRTACVTGAAGYMASILVKQLLNQGYTVHGTVRDPENKSKVAHLVNLPGSDRLKLFGADLTVEGSFDDAIEGCNFVFHVATPVNFQSQDPENDMIKPALQGVLNVLKTCKKKTVKRVVLTSSAAAITINNAIENGQVVTEETWTDTDFLYKEKPPTWGYAVSKTLAEKAAWEFAEENKIDLISVIPTLVNGISLTPDVPSSVCLAMSLLTGNSMLINALKGMQLLSGSISMVHVSDICRAQIFLAEKELASGRYNCSAVNTCLPELAKFLSEKYPQYSVPKDFDAVLSKPKLSVSSEKLIKEGFSFNYGIDEIFNENVDYFKSKGLLPN